MDEDGAVRRAVAGAIAISILMAACALVDPVPPGTRPVQVTVQNNTDVPVDVVVTTPAGVVIGRGAPAVVPVGRVGSVVTIHVPDGDDWTLQLGREARIPGADFNDYASQGCMVGVRLDGANGYSYGCVDEL